MSKTKLTLLVAIIIILSSVCAIAQQTYVRKKVKPDFFIPQNELQKPQKKLPQPKFSAGEEQSIKVAQPQDGITEGTNQVPIAAEIQQQDTPKYQQKYQEYLQDVGEVAKGNDLQTNPELDNDLAKMDSDERIMIDQKFNRSRNPQKDFQKALKRQSN